MARTVEEIKKTMTDAFMKDATIRKKYGLSASDAFGDRFSNVSLENILFFIMAACCHVLEMLFDQYRSDVESRISRAVVASVPWYYRMALDFQLGDPLVLNTDTQQYEYAHVDENKRIVKYAAVRDKGTSIQILVSGDNGGMPEPLPNELLTVFRQYMNRVKVAGVILNISSKESDRILVHAKIYVDPLVIDSKGVSLSDGSSPVEEAVTAFLKSIIYGGTFNKTKLVDAIQGVPGVTDVELGDCYYMASDAQWAKIQGNNYSGDSGSYLPSDLTNTLTYVVQG